jgi:hypothetical protein
MPCFAIVTRKNKNKKNQCYKYIIEFMSKTSTKLEKIISTFKHANISIFKTNTSSKTQNKKL